VTAAEGRPGTGGPPGEPWLHPDPDRPAVAGLGPVTRLVLPNGLTVLVRENRGAPVVALTLLSRGGSADEAPELNGVTALLGRVLLKGTRARSALDVASAAEDAGGGIDSGADQEYGELRAWGLARHWRRLFALLHEVTTESRLDDAEIERERAVLLAQIRGLEDQPAQVANRILARSLFGPRGYGLPASGEEATVARIVRADLLDRLAETYTADRLVLAVSGAVGTDEVLDEAGRLFGGVRPGGEAAPSPTPPERPVRSRQHETSPTQQAHVLLGYLAPSVQAPDHVALKVVNGILGGGMSSRLFRTLRDEQGLAYSVGSAYPTRRGAGRVVLHIGTAPENVASAEAGLRREVDRLAGEPVSEDELERTKAYLSGSFVLDRRTNGRQSFYLAFYETMGVGAEYVMHYPSLLDAVGATDVLRVARRHLVEPAVVVVGPA
jgi:predicted Zn-dependent peptidase